MNPSRFKLIRARLAETLHAAKPRLTPETQLLSDLRLIWHMNILQSELDHVLERMESAGQILRHRTEEEGVKAKLTETGEAELLS